MLKIDNDPKGKNRIAFSIEEKDCQNYILALYENHFFDKAESNLISPAWPKGIKASKLQKQKYDSNILGLLLGTSLNNQRLIRTSLTSMVADVSIQTHFVEGLISCFQKDTESILSIKNFALDLGLDGDFLVNLIDLTASEISPSFMKSIIYMLSTNQNKKDNKMISSFAALFKRDMSLAYNLIQKLKVDQRKATMVLAAAVGDMTILSEFYADIQQHLGLKSEQTVVTLMQLAHGQTKSIYNLREESSRTFKIYNPQLFDSVFKITYYGRLFTEGQIQRVPENVNSDFNHIAKKLSYPYGYPDDETKYLEQGLHLLIRACWSDSESIQKILKWFLQMIAEWKYLEKELGDQIDEFFVQCLDSLKRYSRENLNLEKLSLAKDENNDDYTLKHFLEHLEGVLSLNWQNEERLEQIYPDFVEEGSIKILGRDC